MLTLSPVHVTSVIDHVSYPVVYVVVTSVHLGSGATDQAHVHPAASYSSFIVVTSSSSHAVPSSTGVFHSLSVPVSHINSHVDCVQTTSGDVPTGKVVVSHSSINPASFGVSIELSPQTFGAVQSWLALHSIFSPPCG